MEVEVLNSIFNMCDIATIIHPMMGGFIIPIDVVELHNNVRW
jgi:hypothetical protein